MQASDKARTVTLHECDHMRLVIYDINLGWRHLVDGEPGSECSAGTYQVQATITGRHTVDKLDRRD